MKHGISTIYYFYIKNYHNLCFISLADHSQSHTKLITQVSIILNSIQYNKWKTWRRFILVIDFKLSEIMYTFFSCLECQPGYTGENCDLHCRYPSFGQDCQEDCNCDEKFCDTVNGCNGEYFKILKSFKC